jgi:predicted 2-oxoglutarate/Fe(II)-dependent dioxygenase YbiX
MPSFTTELASLLSKVRRPGSFYVSGATELLAPLCEIDGLGPIALPLLPAQAKQLIAAAEPAPYGRGEETVLDPAVRRCWQIGPDRVHLRGRHWPRTLEAILARVTDGLGVSEPVTAEFYKLLVYEQGGFFTGHRDTEKAPGMFATLVVVMPSHFAGGKLLLRHKGQEVRLDLRAEDPAEVSFAAFYADCVHELLPVTEGYRLALAYNLLRRGRGRLPKPPDHVAEQAQIAALLQSWREDKSKPGSAAPEKLVYLLEHAYTPAELGFAALKGADAAAAGVLSAAARQSDCDLHVALLTVEETGAAEYADSYGSRRRRWDTEDEFEAGEVFERSVSLSAWQSIDGAVHELGAIPVEDEEFSPSGACDGLQPDEEHFHEATGNEGASFERTYRRAALVLWPSDRKLAVLSQAGLPVTLPYLSGLAQRWVESKADKQSSLWREAHDLAKHTLVHWPKQGWYPGRDKTPTDAARMLTQLTRLDDAALIERFLSEITASGCYAKADNEAIIDALGRLALARAAMLIERIVAQTGVTFFAACADLLARAAAIWRRDQTSDLTGAAARLVAALPDKSRRAASGEPWGDAWQSRPKVDAGFVVDLLTGLGVINEALAEQAVSHMLSRPKAYGPDSVLIPAVRKLVRAGAIPSSPAVEQLRVACLAHLHARVAEPLAPPSDWSRASALPCRCRHCAELSRFLADPERNSWVFKAAEADRNHVTDSIQQAGADLDLTTDRRGRPYSLVCTKNQASYERRAKQRKQDFKDLTQLGG